MRVKEPYWILIILVIAVGCTSASPVGRADSSVLTSTSFLADITQNIAGDRIEIVSLLPFGADPHSYQLTPQDVAKIDGSGLIILNGAGYEHFLEPVLDAQDAREKKTIIEASTGLSLREAAN